MLRVFAVLLLASASFAQQPQPTSIKIDVKTPFTFVAFGDLREAPVSNTTATDPVRRQIILNAIADVKPAFVTISGDIPLRGADPEHWKQWNTETERWRAEKLRVLPAIGNHELAGGAEQGLANYFAQFPELKNSRYYSAQAANVMVLSLDSMEPTAEGAQFDWLKSKLESLPKETEFVMVVLHHPPYTNSKSSLLQGGHDARPAEVALGKYLESVQPTLKARIVVVAGHVHNYERYEHSGVQFIVSGGGGATPYDTPRGPGDFYKQPGPTYHYIRVDVNKGALALHVMKLTLQNGNPKWNEVDTVKLVPNAAGQNAPKPDKKAKAAGK